MLVDEVKHIRVKYFCSVLIDMMSIYLALIVSTLLFTPFEMTLKGAVSEYAVVDLMLLFDVIAWGWYFLYYFRKTGRTIGLRILGLQIFCEEREQLSFGVAIPYSLLALTPFTAILLFIVISTSPLYTVDSK